MANTATDASVGDERMQIGVVLDRHASTHPWQDHFWRVGGLIAEGGPGGDWRLLHAAPDVSRFFAGVLPLELFAGECAGYRENLLSRQPSVYVVLRRDVDGHELAPILLTACPAEAQSYINSGDDIVEAVAMPRLVAAWVRAFVDRHPDDAPFVKRARKPNREADSVRSAPFPRPAPPR